MFFDPKSKPIKLHKGRTLKGFLYKDKNLNAVSGDRLIGVFSKNFGVINQSLLEKLYVRVKRVSASPRFSVRF